MKPFLRRLASVVKRDAARVKNASLGSFRSKVIVAGVSTAMMFCLFTGITIASRAVYIKDNDRTYVVYTFSNDPARILRSQNIGLSDNDKIIYNELDGSRAELIVDRAFDVTVSADGVVKTVTMNRGTVSQALDKADVTVSQLDRINIAPGEQLDRDADIVVDRVNVKSVKTKKKIPFKSVVRKTSKLLKGERSVKRKGRSGVSVTKAEEVYVNGALESSRVISKRVTKKPVKQVVMAGTANPVGVDKIYGGGKLRYRGITYRYSKVLVGSGTAYSASNGARTSTGRAAKYGNVAVNPNVIPYGTRLFIKTESGSFVYGKAVAADTGGALRSGSALVDLYFNTDAQCYNFGRRQVEVYILK